MSRRPNLSDVIARALDARLEDVHVSIPASVVRYDSTRQLVDAQPLIKGAYTDEEGARVVERLPVVPNVPVVFPGSGGFRVTFPVTVGDTVLLVFSEASLDKWLSQGGEVDPLDERRHALTDAVAIPGLRDFAHALASAPTDRMTIGADDGPGIHIDDDEVRLGGNTGTAALALKSELDALKTAISNTVVVANDGGASFKSTLLTGLSGWPVGTTVVKAK